MRLSVLSLLFAVTTAATLSSAAEDNKLLGCWKLEELRDYFANGETHERRIPDCFTFFDDRVQTTSCGKPFRRITDEYSLGDPGTITYKRRSSEFSLNGEILLVTTQLKPSAKASPDKAQTRLEAKLMRLPKSSLNECLPAPMTVSKEEFFKMFHVSDLVISYLESSVRSMLILQFTREEFRTKIPEDSLSSEDLKRLLVEIDKIANDAVKSVRPILEKDRAKIADVYFSPGHFGNYIDDNLALEDRKQWAENAVQEILSSQRMSGYFVVISAFSPKLLGSFRDQTRNRVVSDWGLGRSYELDRELLIAFSESPAVLQLLPNRDEVARNGKLGLKNAKEAESKLISGLDGNLERAVQLTANTLQTRHGQALLPEETQKAAREAISVLARRLRLLNPVAWESGEPDSGPCSKGNLDQKSLVGSNGDWKKIRTLDGAPIVLGSWGHYAAFTRFAYCDSPRNFKAARRVLGDIVALDAPPMGHGKECELAHWYRYGIGGEKSESKAAALEKRFEAWAAGSGRTGQRCAPQSRIDPRDPWKDLN
ncbi:MAG TPA: hypothetical protein VFW68_10970 [Rhodocyclaceae bacterium]|nr:hypothetical protein [Rhodocyclaceae bacterium]